MTAHPTGHCFDDALELIEAFVRETPALALDPTLLLVHGIVLAPDDTDRAGEPYSHAWVEHRGEAWHGVLVDGERCYVVATIAEYRAAMRVQDVTTYTVRQAYDANREHGTFGPWVERYRQLCGRRVFVPMSDSKD